MAGELSSFPSSLTGAVARLRMITLLRSQGVARAELDSLFVSIQGLAVVGSRLTESSDESFKMYSVRTGSENYIFVDGITGAAQGELLANGYTGPRLRAAGGGTNALLETAGAFAGDRVVDINPAGRVFYLAGYSAGGAALQYAADRIVNLIPGEKAMYLTSFGGPAARGSNRVPSNVVGEQFNTAAWFMSNDPVPLIPPAVGIWPGFWAGLTPAQVARLATFNPLRDGRQVNQIFQVTAQTVPTEVVPPVTAAVGTWLNAQVTGIRTPHSLDVYLAAFRAASGLVPDANVPPPLVVQPPAQVPPTVAQVRGQRQAFVETIIRDQRRQSEGPLVIPRERLFDIRNQDGLYAVYFGDVQVYITPTRRKAALLVHAANQFLRRFQRGAVVDPGQLISQLTTYLAIASLPDGPIQPALNLGP